MTLISVFPILNLLNLLCCAGIILGGFAGSAFYAKQLEKAGGLIQFKDGAAIGILSGLLSALLVVIITTLITLISATNPVPEIYKLIEQYGYGLPPEAEKMLQRISNEYNEHGFSITITLFTLIIDIINYPLFGFLGGIIASSIYGKRTNA
ncbi:MAG TPA: hypothetical protein VGK25_08670 [Ignavibacteria bacterium]|jgi:hypothetical protein